MKKIISVALCIAILLISVIVPVDASEKNPAFQLVGDEIYIPANQILMSAYNLENETNYKYYVYFEDAKNSANTVKFNFYDCLKDKKLVNVDSCEYNMYKGNGSTRSGYTKVRFNEGAYYQKIRVRVCDFFRERYIMRYVNGEPVYDYRCFFQENGDLFYYRKEKGDFNFNFTNTPKVQESGIYILSGSAFTAVKPDENGMIEFYVKKGVPNLPYLSGFATEYIDLLQFTVDLGGNLELGVGNVDFDMKISITDATLLQKFCTGLESLGEAQMYFADVNGDGVVNVVDSTEIQKYCAGI